jgi:hypothetical protein
MPRYVVIHPIEHDGKRVEVGTIDLTEKQAAPLRAIGHIAQPKQRAARAPADTSPAVQTPVPSPSSPEGDAAGDADDDGDQGADDSAAEGAGTD